MRPFFAACLVATLVTASPVCRAASVLFLGNSFTIGGTASVPTIFDRLSQAGGKGDPDTVMQATGGVDYKYHATDPATLAVITSRAWDYVVMQNFSVEPTHFVDGTHSIANHFTYGASLYDRILANNSATKIVLFETWSRAAAHPYITGISSPTSFASTSQMQSELRSNYYGLANQLNSAHPANPLVAVAPIGDAWENAGGLRAASDPLFVDLHGSDDYHGDDDGYYLAAAVIYSQIYGTSAQGLSTNAAVASLNLSRNVSAPFLEGVAWNTVQSVPEPSVGLLALGGCACIGGRRRRSAAIELGGSRRGE